VLDIGSPLGRELEARVQEGFAVPRGVGEEDADLAVIDFAQAATPLAVDATGVGPLLGKAGGVEDEDTLAVGQLRGDMAAEFVEQGTILPAAGTDEELQGAEFLAGLGGDGFGGLALQGGELALQHSEGMAALLAAVEEGQVTLSEGGQVVHAGADGSGGNDGVAEEGLGCGLLENIHGGLQQ